MPILECVLGGMTVVLRGVMKTAPAEQKLFADNLFALQRAGARTTNRSTPQPKGIFKRNVHEPGKCPAWIR